MKDAEGNDVRFGFRNVHYFAAGATLYGSQAQMGYEYDGKLYDPKFRHVAEVDTCVACHNQHTLEVRIETCQECHTNVTSTDDLKNVRMQGSLEDYNGNGDVTEGIAAELAGLAGNPVHHDAGVCQGRRRHRAGLRRRRLSVLVRRCRR